MNRAIALVAMLTAFTLTSPLAARAGTPTGEMHAGKMYTLVNVTFDSVTALSVAPAGTAGFAKVELGEPLQGGLTSATVRMPAGTCLRDVRVTFGAGYEQTFAHVDICRSSGLRLAAPAHQETR
jgi:hypothetical protein